MAELLNLRQAARLAGVSPNRLYRAIKQSRLSASVGGGPGKSTLVSYEALQAWCASEGLTIPVIPERVERAKRLERSERLEREDRSERSEHTERSIETLVQQMLDTFTGQMFAQVMERQNAYFEAFLREELHHLVDRVMEQVAERLVERLATHPPAPSERSPERSTPTALPSSSRADRAAMIKRLQAMKADGLTTQAMADALNRAGVPTLSGRGQWRKGTIANLLAEGG